MGSVIDIHLVYNWTKMSVRLSLPKKFETGQTCLSWTAATSYDIAITRIGDYAVEIRLWHACLNPKVSNS